MNAEDPKLEDLAKFIPVIRNSVAKGVTVLTWGYLVVLVLWLAGLEWIGERHWLFSIGIYLPIQIWLLPLGLLVPLSLFLRPRFCLVHLGCVFLVMGVFGQYRFGSRSSVASADSLTIVTNNIGQSNHQSMQPFLAKENPDLIVLQEAWNRGPAYTRQYPDRFVVGRSEFILISKYPVLSADVVNEVRWRNTPVAARFELNFKGKPLVVYNVHMPTPRGDFAKIRGAGLAREIIGRNRRRSDGMSYSESMAARVELARHLREVFRKETKPFIVAGDFNMPDHGAVYHIISGVLVDAFDKTGAGYGYTFPGVSSRVISFFGPWLRIDYLFAGTGWKPVYSRVEPDRKSQHRAVVARFEPQNL